MNGVAMLPAIFGHLQSACPKSSRKDAGGYSTPYGDFLSEPATWIATCLHGLIRGLSGCFAYLMRSSCSADFEPLIYISSGLSRHHSKHQPTPDLIRKNYIQKGQISKHTYPHTHQTQASTWPTTAPAPSAPPPSTASPRPARPAALYVFLFVRASGAPNANEVRRAAQSKLSQCHSAGRLFFLMLLFQFEATG
jgi:hypothetical protein